MTKHAGRPEDLVKARLRRVLGQHFLFAEEVPGDGPYQRVRIDFWCYPGDHLLGAGWEPAPIAIEAKGHLLEDHRKRTAVAVVYQAIIYSLARFPTRAGPRRPHWVLIHPPLSAIVEAEPSRETFGGGVLYGLSRLAAKFNVGEFAITPDGFEVLFHGGVHYSTKRGFNGANRLTDDRDAASR